MAQIVQVHEVSPGGLAMDGTKEGVLKTRVTNESMVKIPYTAFKRYSFIAGNGTINASTPSLYNSDGTSIALNFSNTTAINDTVYIEIHFKGTFCAIRYQEAISLPNVCYTIDDKAYYPPKTRRNGSNIAFGTMEQTYILASNLPEGDHILTIRKYYKPSNNVSFVLHGLIVDSSNGYTPILIVDQVYSSGLLTTSAANLPTLDTNTGLGIKAIKKIRYVNTSGSPATVTLTHAGNNYEPPTNKTIAAGEVYEIVLSTGAFKLAELQHLASVGSAIRFFCIGIF